MKRLTRALAAAVLTVLPLSAQAASMSFQSFDNGWYGSNGSHHSSNLNTFTGRGSNIDTRSFYAFNLAALNNVTVTSATLVFRNNGTYRMFGAADLRIFDVTSNTNAVLGGGGTSVFHDLGSGGQLAQRTLSRSYNTPMPSFGMTMSSYAVNLINQAIQAQDSRFVIGARVVSPLSSGQGIWYNSTGTSAARIMLTYEENAPEEEAPVVPLPASIPLLLSGLAAIGLTRSRRRS